MIDRLRKLLGLLGSDFEGERAVAGQMASNLLRQHKLTWADVLGADGKAVAAPPARVWREPKGHVEAAAECAAWPEILTLGDRVPQVGSPVEGSLTARQAQCLCRVVDKTRQFARASGAQFT